MEIAFGASAYRRNNGRLPELRLINLFLEASPTSENGTALLSRAGLSQVASVGTGPVQGIYWRDGLFGGDVFTVSGGRLYRGATDLGATPGAGPISFASSDVELVVTAGGVAYSYNGTNLAAIAFPDDAAVRAVAYIGGLFVFARAGSHKFYWSAVLNGRTIDPLSFASAETAPDEIMDVLAIGETLWLLGAATIEPWALTGALELPFQRIDQQLVRKGVVATGCARDLDNALHLVGDDGIVYRMAEAPARISDHGLEERIKASAGVSTFILTIEGHNFFCVRLDEGTFAFDAATRQWCEFATYGRANFRARCAVVNGREVRLGDDETGALYTLDGFTDAGAPLERLFTAAARIQGGSLRVDRLNVDVNVGSTELLAGQGSEPEIEMRSSRDAGATWGTWEATRMGAQGEYRMRPEWRALGLFDFPGAMFEFRVTDPLGVRLSSVQVNERGGGRSR